MRYTQKGLNFLIKILLLLHPSEHTDFLHCYNTNSCSMPLRLVLVKSKLDKAVITHVFTSDVWILSAQVL